MFRTPNDRGDSRALEPSWRALAAKTTLCPTPCPKRPTHRDIASPARTCPTPTLGLDHKACRHASGYGAPKASTAGVSKVGAGHSPRRRGGPLSLAQLGGHARPQSLGETRKANAAEWSHRAERAPGRTSSWPFFADDQVRPRHQHKATASSFSQLPELAGPPNARRVCWRGAEKKTTGEADMLERCPLHLHLSLRIDRFAYDSDDLGWPLRGRVVKPHHKLLDASCEVSSNGYRSISICRPAGLEQLVPSRAEVALVFDRLARGNVAGICRWPEHRSCGL